MVTCDDVIASIGDVNVILSCKIKARPEVTSLYWVVDINDTNAVNVGTPGGKVADSWTTVVRVSRPTISYSK